MKMQSKIALMSAVTVVTAALGVTHGPAAAAESCAEVRDAARMMARIEASLAARDVKDGFRK